MTEGQITIRLWGNSTGMSGRERARLAEWLARNMQIDTGLIVFTEATEQDLRAAAKREIRSKRGGVDGG